MKKFTNAGEGSTRRGDGSHYGDVRRIVCQFDTETFSEIRTRAVKNQTSVAEQIRLLVEWGLEAPDRGQP